MRIRPIERFAGTVGYLPLLCLIVARWVKRDSLFVQFHARQGAVLFGLWFALALVLFVALAFISDGVVGQILMGLLFLATALYGLMMLVGILKVLLGERYRMPVVADVALMLGL